jgi:hypothetical protein
MLQQMSDIQPVAQPSPRNICWLWAAAQTNGAGAASRDAEKKAKYGAGEQVAAGGLMPLPTDRYGKMGSPAQKFLQSLPWATAAVSFCSCSWFRGDDVSISGWCFARTVWRVSTPERGGLSGGNECLCHCRRHSCHTWCSCANS